MGAPSGTVLPAYGANSLSDVLPAVSAALGLDAAATGWGPVGLTLPAAEAYVVMLVDGLGYEQLTDHRHHAPFLADLAASSSPGTATAPSTTSTSLASLGTGMPPGTHGMLGFTTRVPGTDSLLNALSWREDVDPLAWQPHLTAFQRLGQAGAVVRMVGKEKFQDSGLTVAALRGAEYVGGNTAAARLSAASRAAAECPSLTYVYVGDVDHAGHRHGVDSPEWRAALRGVDAEAEGLAESLPHGARLLVLADHGMVDTLGEHRLDVDEVPAVRQGIRLLGGEARLRHLYCIEGAIGSVAACWRDWLGDRAVVRTRDQAVAEGWFGPVDPANQARLGDVVAAALGTTSIFSSRDFLYETSLTGVHGSLTSAEMLVPLLVC